MDTEIFELFKKTEKYKYIQMIFESIEIPILLVHKTHIILLQNKAAYELFGSKEGGLCWQELWDGETLSENNKKFYEQGKVLSNMACHFCVSNEALESQKSITKELYIFGKYWESCWVPITKDIYMHYFIDVSKRKSSEEKYKQSQKFLREVADLVPDLIWVKDLDKRYTFTNKANCEKLLGISDIYEPIGKTQTYFADKIRAEKPNDPYYYTFDSLCQDSDQQVINTKKSLRFNELGNVKGKRLYLDVIKVPWFDNKGKLIGVLGTARDVTIEKTMEKELKESREKLEQSLIYHKAIFDNNAAVMIVVDENRTIIDLNSTALNAFGYEKEELVGKNTIILHPSKSSYDNFTKEFKDMLDGQTKSKTIEFNFKRKDSSFVWMEVKGSPINLPNGKKGVVWSAIDTTEIHKLKEKLKHRALHDPLTGTYNRYFLEDEAERAMARVKRNNTKLAVCLFDLDDFKSVNDIYGHEAGDKVLKTTASRLKQIIRKTDFIVRLGGDEFVILLENISSSKQLESIFVNILQEITKTIDIAKDVKVSVKATIGAVLYPDVDASFKILLRLADTAMYRLKKNKSKREKHFGIYEDGNVT